jgi:hypothetical protein
VPVPGAAGTGDLAGGGSSAASTIAASPAVRGLPGRGRPSSPLVPSAAYRFSRKSTAGLDAPVRRTISSVPRPSSASSTILARCASPARIEGERPHKVSTSRSRGGTFTLTVNAVSHAPRNATSSQGTSLTAQ